MTVLYLTDNREQYRQGNYYVDWLNAFKKKFPGLVVFGPGYDTKVEEVPLDVDLLIYGHSFMELYLRNKFYFFRSSKFHGLDIQKFKNINSIMFSKNEYKLMGERISFLKERKNALLVCYTKMTEDKYKKTYSNMHWAPFGIDTEKFVDRKMVRDISIGMRGNRHASYIGQLREDVAASLMHGTSYTTCDIKLSDNGEDFLHGEDYIQWLNRCKLVGNTKSAMDIVNPKFAETIACGAIPVCPVDYYEGLLEKDKHYIDMTELEKIKTSEKFMDFYLAKKEIFDMHRNHYINKFSYSSMLENILKKI